VRVAVCGKCCERLFPFFTADIVLVRTLRHAGTVTCFNTVRHNVANIAKCTDLRWTGYVAGMDVA